MNKKMRELLAKIEEKTKAARTAQDAGETEKAAGLLKEIDPLRSEYETEKALFALEQDKVPDEPEQKKGEMSADEKAFVEYCAKAAGSLSAGNNGAVIPTTIANKIIEEVKELSPILSMVTPYNATGKLAIPTYGKDGSDEIQAAYGEEFTELTEHAGKFGAVELDALMVGALTKISKKLINNATVDTLPFITRKMGSAFAEFFERELLAGTGAKGRMTGATTTTNLVQASAATLAAITADLLIDVQAAVPQVYQAKAVWLMNKDVLKAVRKLKDSNGDYLLTRSLVEGFSWDLLGKPVYISENMPAVAAGAVPVLYGDMSGMAFKLGKQLELQVLNEKYAAQYATGIVGWAEVDSKIENAQKFVGVQMKPGSGS